ncbi:hypothetical protein KJN74_03605 [Candidatus Bathyarchaeota archaeon]|nr:hypothetical protein [Candidatus Bathyarchaeota archaeon]
MGQIIGLLDVIMDSGVLIPGLALCFGFYIAYIFLSARHVVPMTTNEIETLWKFHKQTKCCKANNWKEITKKKKLIGYECECGHRHVQKKPLITVG